MKLSTQRDYVARARARENSAGFSFRVFPTLLALPSFLFICLIDNACDLKMVSIPSKNIPSSYNSLPDA